MIEKAFDFLSETEQHLEKLVVHQSFLPGYKLDKIRLNKLYEALKHIKKLEITFEDHISAADSSVPFDFSSIKSLEQLDFCFKANNIFMGFSERLMYDI